MKQWRETSYIFKCQIYMYSPTFSDSFFRISTCIYNDAYRILKHKKLSATDEILMNCNRDLMYSLQIHCSVLVGGLGPA